jgi:hypothetical protein
LANFIHLSYPAEDVLALCYAFAQLAASDGQKTKNIAQVPVAIDGWTLPPQFCLFKSLTWPAPFSC